MRFVPPQTDLAPQGSQFVVAMVIGVRADIHLGGADRVLPEWIQWGGGSSRHFPGSIFSGGGVVAEISRDPYYVGCQNFFR